jgi:hypothetical protein
VRTCPLPHPSSPPDLKIAGAGARAPARCSAPEEVEAHARGRGAARRCGRNPGAAHVGKRMFFALPSGERVSCCVPSGIEDETLPVVAVVDLARLERERLCCCLRGPVTARVALPLVAGASVAGFAVVVASVPGGGAAGCAGEGACGAGGGCGGGGAPYPEFALLGPVTSAVKRLAGVLANCCCVLFCD